MPDAPIESLSRLLRELAAEPELAPAVPAEPSLPAGTLIGRFELRREIGRGGFGIVYEARDTALGRSVAFKLVRGGKRMDLRRERLVREAEAAARVSHPNVVTLHDLGSSEYGPYLVLELLQGETLASRLRRAPMAAAEATAIAVQIARGLAHAHGAGVVHGDVTPRNVFLCSDGRVKVLDLGLARVFGSSSSDSGGGTQGYVAPEVRSGAPASPRSDVYSLGVVLFKMLAGTLPYRADDDPGRAPLPLRDAPALASAIERMVAADAADRPEDAGAVLELLEATSGQLSRRSQLLATRRRLAAALAMVGVLAVTAVAGALGLRGRGGSGAPPPASASLAVLPFVDRSEQRDQSHVSEGIADQLRTALGRVEALRVLGRQSSTSVDAKLGLEATARTLGVSHLLVGSARLVGDRLDVDAELRDAAGGRVWTRSYSSSIGDVFSVQNDIAERALAALGVPPAAGKPAPRATPVDPEAYTEFLRGRQHYYRGAPEGWRLAREAYERSVARAPDFAPAWSGLGAMLILTTPALGTATAIEARSLHERGMKALEKSLALDPDLVDAHALRGFVLGVMQHDWARAIAEYDRALALEPNNPETLRRYSHVVGSLGRIDDAIAAAAKAADRDPLDSKTWATLATFHAYKGDLEAAERACRRSLAISPDGTGQPVLGDILLLESKPKDSLAAFARSPEVFRLAGTAMAEHSLGHPEQSRAALDELTTKYAHAAAYMVARVHFWEGTTDRGFEWLDRAVANGEPAVGEIRFDSVLKRVRGDARYAALLRRLRLPAD